MPVRVLIVDDHEMVRAGLRALLRRSNDIEVVGEVATVSAAVTGAANLKPDVVLMDLRLPDGSGVEACREVLSDVPGTRVLILTSYPDEQAVIATILAGASGYLLKDISFDTLTRAILNAAAGRPVNDSQLTAQAARKIERVRELSSQESRVLAHVVEGKTNKEIAAALDLSDKTVKNYLSNAFQKLHVTRRSEAAAVFVRGGGSENG